MAADSALDRNEIEVADARCDPWVGLLLGRDQQRPIGRIGDIFEKIDRRKSAAYDPDSTELSVGCELLSD